MGYVFVTERKRKRDNDPSLENVRNNDLENLETGGQAIEMSHNGTAQNENYEVGKTQEIHELITVHGLEEDKLIQNLTPIKEDNEEKAAKQELIRTLVSEATPGMSAEELISAYNKREDELIKYLYMLQARDWE